MDDLVVDGVRGIDREAHIGACAGIGRERKDKFIAAAIVERDRDGGDRRCVFDRDFR